MKSVFSVMLALCFITLALATPLLGTNVKKPRDKSRQNSMKFISDSVRQRGTRSVYSQAVITFAATDEAWLFVNHEERGHLDDPKASKVVSVDAKRGDVIAFKVRSNGAHRGIAVNVEYKGINYPSNGDPNGSWRAHKSTGPYTSWMLSLYSSCDWWHPTLAQPDVAKANDFPHAKTGASYVWAKSNGDGDINNIWMRHVVGEENCRRQSGQGPRKRLVLCDLSTPACQAIWGLIPGLEGAGSSTDSDPEVECQCRRVDGPISKCYRMDREGSRFGRCQPEICGDKYECVEDDGKNLLKCKKRVAKFQVVPYFVFRNYCKLQSLPSPKIFYVFET